VKKIKGRKIQFWKKKLSGCWALESPKKKRPGRKRKKHTKGGGGNNKRGIKKQSKKKPKKKKAANFVSKKTPPIRPLGVRNRLGVRL